MRTLVAILVLALGLVLVQSAAPAAAQSTEAKQACAQLKKKAKKAKSKAKRKKLMRKYRKCLAAYDADNGGGGDLGGGGGDLGGGGGGGGGQPPAATQCTEISTCPYMTRNDGAGQAKFAQGGGRLFLERADFYSVSAEYYRIFFYETGTFRFSVIDWNQQMGEKCRTTHQGTWQFLEGYTYEVEGGGVVAKVRITTPSASGDDLLFFPNNDSNGVWVGSANKRYDRNPNMADSC